MNPFYKNLALWLVISLMMVMLFQMFKQPDRSRINISYSDFLNMVESGGVNQVTIQGENITGMSGQGPFKTYAPKDPELISMLRSKGVAISAKPMEESPWFQVFLSWVPMLLLIGVWIFFMRQMQAGGGKALSFGKSRARLMSDAQDKVTFEDVAGIDEAKEELGEIVDFLSDPKKFTRLGGRIPKGVLLVGSPGTGKPFWPAPLPAKPAFPFLPSADRILWKCLWVWAPPGSGTCSTRAKRTPHALFSLMRSTPWAGIAGRAWAAATMNGSRP